MEAASTSAEGVPSSVEPTAALDRSVLAVRRRARTASLLLRALVLSSEYKGTSSREGLTCVDFDAGVAPTALGAATHATPSGVKCIE